MTTTTCIGLSLSAALVSLGLAFAPAVFAEDKMGKDDGMKKESMSKDAMKKRRRHDEEGRHEARRHDERRHEKRRRHEKEPSRAVIPCDKRKAFAQGSDAQASAPEVSRSSMRPLRIRGLALTHQPGRTERAELSSARDGGARFARFLVAYFFLPLPFARGVTGVALGLLLGLHRGPPGGLFFLLARDPGGLRRGGLGLEAFLFGLCRLLGLSRLGAGGGLGFALGLTALHLGIVESRLGAKLVQNVLSRLHRGLLAVREVRFLESTHRRGLVAFTLGVGRATARGMAPW